MKMKYYTKRMTALSEVSLSEISNLYSHNYGSYSSESTVNLGKRIRYSIKMYKKNYTKDDYYISYAVDDSDKLIGFAIYIRKQYQKKQTITWVVQLVVDIAYRGKGIASRILQSIWGFSDDFAWGLATTNSCTIKALENATFRKVSSKYIMSHLSELSAVFEDVPFTVINELELDESHSLINSHFYVDYSSVVTPEREQTLGLGRIKPGYEWFAFVFRDQPLDKTLIRDKFHTFISFSESKLIDAYKRMLPRQGWMRGTNMKAIKRLYP